MLLGHWRTCRLGAGLPRRLGPLRGLVGVGPGPGLRRAGSDTGVRVADCRTAGRRRAQSTASRRRRDLEDRPQLSQAPLVTRNQEVGQVGQGQGMADQVTLYLIAAKLPQHVQLLGRFHTFRHHFQAKRMRQIDDHLDHLALLGAVNHSGDEGLVHLEHGEGLLLGEAVSVHAQNNLAPGVNPRLGAGRGLLDAQLGQPGLDGLHHAAQGLDLVDVRHGPGGEIRRETLHIRRAPERIRHAAGWYLQLDPGRNMGKTNALNGDDPRDFVECQEKFSFTDKSWVVKVAGIDTGTYDLSVKNPNAPEETPLRDPADIIAEIIALDTETAEILENIRRAV